MIRWPNRREEAVFGAGAVVVEPPPDESTAHITSAWRARLEADGTTVIAAIANATTTSRKWRSMRPPLASAGVRERLAESTAPPQPACGARMLTAPQRGRYRTKVGSCEVLRAAD